MLWPDYHCACFIREETGSENLLDQESTFFQISFYIPGSFHKKIRFSMFWCSKAHSQCFIDSPSHSNEAGKAGIRVSIYGYEDRDQDRERVCPRPRNLLCFEPIISKSKFKALFPADSGIALKTYLDAKTSNYSTNIIECLLYT